MKSMQHVHTGQYHDLGRGQRDLDAFPYWDYDGSPRFGWVAYWTLTTWRTPSHIRRIEKLQRGVDSSRLLDNFRWQFEVLFHLPKPWSTWKSMKPYVFENIVSLAALAAFAISVLLLMSGFLADPSFKSRDEFLSAGILTFTLSLNFFVIFRQLIYYQEKLRVGGESAIDAGLMPESVSAPDVTVPYVNVHGASPQLAPAVLGGGGVGGSGNGPTLHAPTPMRPTATATPSPGASPNLGPTGIARAGTPSSVASLAGTPPPPSRPSTAGGSRLQAYASTTRGTVTGPQERQSIALNTQGMKLPTYYTFDWSLKNAMQLAILVVEFIQLISFPLRDLLNNPALKELGPVTDNLVDVVDRVIRIFTLIPDQLSGRVVSEFQFWGFFSVICTALVLAVTLAVVKYYFKQNVPMDWVFVFVPPASIFYLPFLVTFVSNAACMTQQYKSQALRCGNQTGSESIYFVCSVLGFLISYLLLTLFLSADERRPIEGDITFKSSSVAFMKNFGFLLVLVSLLVPVQRPVTRGLLSWVIITVMCAYNIRKRPCYVYSVNFIRTGTLSLILWTTMVTTVLNDYTTIRLVGIPTVWVSFVSGYTLVILALYIAYRVHMSVRDLKLQVLLPAMQLDANRQRQPQLSYTGVGSRPRASTDLIGRGGTPDMIRQQHASGPMFSPPMGPHRGGLQARAFHDTPSPAPLGSAARAAVAFSPSPEFRPADVPVSPHLAVGSPAIAVVQQQPLPMPVPIPRQEADGNAAEDEHGVVVSPVAAHSTVVQQRAVGGGREAGDWDPDRI
ncbi:hypothetical protein BCR44DRAFT_1510281 [Catenaria anguillulae PL171]|uniref:Uncharacterized protein n=1 Tax=Catenaria anguillulae PL171 TaxID=765915 RepID=A0A1Y2HZZ7_9FUNG|nr:hypothetical protein BCR44DRAFT_1510281 [Catenaria anguillulae PL171]